MSIRVMSWVWDHSPVKGGELLLLLAIADHADDNGGNAWPSVDRLTSRTRVDRRTVQRILRSLERKGLVMVERGTGPGGTNRYTIILVGREDDSDEPVDNSAAKRRPGRLPPAGQVPPGGRHGAAAGAVLMPPEPSLTVHEPGASRLAELVPTADLTADELDQVLGLIERAEQAGWPLHEIRRVIATPVCDTAHLGSVLTSRLRSLISHAANTRDRLRSRGGSPARPPWCGACDETTRHRQNASGALYRCPRCHPLSASPRSRS